MAISPGATLRELRARKPLIHQITNYVVMNETANATLALGALPVMAHAPQEVEEMASVAGALVLNIGTLSEHWVEAMLLAGKAAAGADRPRPRRRRRDSLPHRYREAAVRGARHRGRPGKCRRDRDACRPRVRDPRSRVDGQRGLRGRPCPRGRTLDWLASSRSPARSTTSPTASASDRDLERPRAARNGLRDGLHVHGRHRSISRQPSRPSRSRPRPKRSSLSASPERTPRVDAKGPGTFHANLYDALHNLDPGTLDARAKVEDEAPRDRR